jgi:predicted dehydrogenase
MGKIKTAVVGAGSMGANHMRVYKALAHMCDLIGIYDTDPDRCEEMARRYGVNAFDSLDAVWDEADAASIAVPTVHHFDVAGEALARGVHILLEKPIAESVEQGEALTRMARERGLTLQIGHVERFNPAVQILPEILNGKEIIGLDFRRMSPYDARIGDVGVVHDLMIHDIDVLRALKPAAISDIQAFGSSPRSGVHTDYAVAALMMEGGIIANLTASRVTEQKVRKIAVTTDRAYIELDYLDRKITVARATQGHFIDGGKPSYRQENIIEKVFVPNQEPLMKEIESFIDCVESGDAPMVGGEDGVAALVIANHIETCIQNKRGECV